VFVGGRFGRFRGFRSVGWPILERRAGRAACVSGDYRVSRDCWIRSVAWVYGDAWLS